MSDVASYLVSSEDAGQNLAEACDGGLAIPAAVPSAVLAIGLPIHKERGTSPEGL